MLSRICFVCGIFHGQPNRKWQHAQPLYYEWMHMISIFSLPRSCIFNRATAVYVFWSEWITFVLIRWNCLWQYFSGSIRWAFRAFNAHTYFYYVCSICYSISFFAGHCQCGIFLPYKNPIHSNANSTLLWFALVRFRNAHWQQKQTDIKSAHVFQFGCLFRRAKCFEYDIASLHYSTNACLCYFILCLHLGLKTFKIHTIEMYKW